MHLWNSSSTAAGMARASGESGHVWPNSAEIGPSRAKFGPNLAKFGRNWRQAPKYHSKNASAIICRALLEHLFRFRPTPRAAVSNLATNVRAVVRDARRTAREMFSAFVEHCSEGRR